MNTNSISSFAEHYFHPLTPETSGQKVNKLKATGKILSYFTVVIPLVFALAWGCDSLRGRAKPMNAKSQQAEKASVAVRAVFRKQKTPKEAVDEINRGDYSLGDYVNARGALGGQTRFDIETAFKWDFEDVKGNIKIVDLSNYKTTKKDLLIGVEVTKLFASCPDIEYFAPPRDISSNDLMLITQHVLQGSQFLKIIDLSQCSKLRVDIVEKLRAYVPSSVNITSPTSYTLGNHIMHFFL